MIEFDSKKGVQMSVFKKTIALDFDGVIHNYAGWKGADVFEGPIDGAREFLESLYMKLNFKIAIHTTRKPGLVYNWLVQTDMAQFVSSITNEKPLAVAYVDDRGIRFNGDFDEILKTVERGTDPWWKK